MRRLLGLTRPDGAELAPMPNLSDLPTLAARIEAAGLPVRVRLTGEPADLPTGVALAVYRITQEALTNALKHAGRPATAEVSIHCGPDLVDVRIVNDGCGTGASPRPGTGLRNMHERAAMIGGTFDAHVRPTGGFEVHARLPVTAALA